MADKESRSSKRKDRSVDKAVAEIAKEPSKARRLVETVLNMDGTVEHLETTLTTFDGVLDAFADVIVAFNALIDRVNGMVDDLGGTVARLDGIVDSAETMLLPARGFGEGVRRLSQLGRREQPETD